MKRTRAYYEKILASFDDVVKMPDFRKMLGGISGQAAYAILRSGNLRHFCISKEYFFPKVWIIDYILSDAYQSYKDKLKVQV